MSLSVAGSEMKIHSEDMARVIDSVPFYSDVQLSQICLDQSNSNKIVYYVKLLKVTYKDGFKEISFES